MATDALRRCVGDVDAFAAEHWGRSAMVRRAEAGFDDLLDIDGIEEILTDLARRPTFRLVRDGSPLPPAEYTVRTRVGGTDIDDVADVDRILDHVAAGATLVLQGLQRFWPPLARFCLDVEATLSHPVQANAYLSPPSAAGLARHADRHDVLVLQVSGTKRWDVEGLGDLTLGPGDVTYLPAGTHHAARTSTSSSLHITLGVLAVTYRQVMHRTIDAIEDRELDRPLPLGFATGPCAGSLAEGLAAAARRTGAELAAVDAADVAQREIDRRRRRARRRWTGRLRAVVEPEAISDATVVRRRRPFVLRASGDQVTLRAADRQLRLPVTTGSALKSLAVADPVRVGDLPGLDDDDRAVLVRRLVREGVVEVVG